MQICESCHCGCCRNYTVGLTGYDILNIAKNLHIEPPSFMYTIPVEEKDVEAQSKYTALFKFTDGNPDTFYRFSLRMDESRLVPGTTKCQFLMEWYSDPIAPSQENIVAKCGIYNHRPLVCATYPSKMDGTGKRGIVLNVKIPDEKLEHSIYKQCKREIIQSDIESSSEQIMKALILRKYEVEYFNDLAEYWNKKPGSLSDFLAFIKKVYANRVIVE